LDPIAWICWGRGEGWGKLATKTGASFFSPSILKGTVRKKPVVKKWDEPKSNPEVVILTVDF